MKSPDLSHHRAYRSVHGGSLVFINLQVIAGHGHIALTGYFFIRTRPSFPCCQWALKKQPLQRLLENIIYLLGTLVYSMASIFELFQHPIRLLEACA